jgi:hypothetical protein
MPTKRNRTKPATRKELLEIIGGDGDEWNSSLGSLRRLLRCLERPDVRAAVSTAIADDFARDLDDKIIVGRAVGENVIAEVIKMAADFEFAIEREGYRRC